MVALLCALFCAPGVLHARVCLVALGVVDTPACCEDQRASCCEPEVPAGPSLAATGMDCRCCLEVDLEGRDRLPQVTPDQPTPIAAPVLRLVCELEVLPAPSVAGERARLMLVRERERPATAAPIPLRI